MTDHRDEKKVDCRECNQNEEGGEIQKWSYVDVNSHVLDCFSRYAAKWKHYNDNARAGDTDAHEGEARGDDDTQRD
jgi:transcription elongation factor Elf1